ncbi:HAD hydrolase-like protein [Paracoccaceae bacterium GXU_MW_L88]
MIKGIYLDLDGTLVDSRESIITSIQYTMKEIGAEHVDEETIRWVVGPPLEVIFQELLGLHADLEEAMEIYRAHYTGGNMYEADVFDGIGEMLMDLRETEAGLWIATSKPASYANKIIEHFGIDAHVDGLFGSEESGHNADKTDLIAHALNETEVEAHEAIMIGDRKYDIIGAKNNGVPSIGALWGFGEEGELHMAEADALAGHPDDVLELVLEIAGVEL